MEKAYLIISSIGVLSIFGCMVGSYAQYLKPRGKQDQAALALVLTVAVLVGIMGLLFTMYGLRGNAQAQLQYLFPIITFILLPTTIISATVGAYQLYGLREAVAAGKQT